MDKSNSEFGPWFFALCVSVLDQCGVEFTDEEDAQRQYDQGRDVFDLIDEIAAEYNE